MFVIPMPFVRRTVLVAVAIAVVTGGGVAAVAVLTSTEGTFPSIVHPSAAPRTSTVQRYQPWVDGEPARSLHVITAAGDANCWEGSISSPRTDAYRCSTQATYEGGNLFDPCFASPTDVHRMLCPSAPLAAHRVVAVVSTRPGPPNDLKTEDTGLPWDIELAGDVSCRDVSGASAVIDGQRAVLLARPTCCLPCRDT